MEQNNKLQIRLIDSHCHLDYKELASDIPKVIKSAKHLGVEKYITICTKIKNLHNLKNLADNYNDIWFTAGIHPHEASNDPYSFDSEKLKKSTVHKKCIAIGEAGLDFYYDFASKSDQYKCFEMQISVAQELNLPIVIHSRNADREMIDILNKSYKFKPFSGVLHCFTGGKDLSNFALDIGFYISFSGILTFKNSIGIQSIARTIPNDKFLVETDSPFLSPIPFRGKNNEPKNTYYVAKFISELKNTSIEKIAFDTWNNTIKLFKRMKIN